MGGARVYIGGLPYDVREKDIEGFFRGYGRLGSISIKNGYGFVEFDSFRDADVAAYALNGKDLLGKRVIVQRARGVPIRVRSLRSGARVVDGGGGRSCFKCSEVGHMAKDCPNNETLGNRPSGCRKFNQEDNLALLDSQTGAGDDPGVCKRRFSYSCGEASRISREDASPRIGDVDRATSSILLREPKEDSVKSKDYVPEKMLKVETICDGEQQSKVSDEVGTPISKSESIPDLLGESLKIKDENEAPLAESFDQLHSSIQENKTVEICDHQKPSPIQCHEPSTGLDEIGSCELLSEPHGIPTLELLSRSNHHINRGEQLLSVVQLAVYDQLKNWGIGLETPSTRGRSRSKTRQYSGNKSSSIYDNGAARLVETKLKNWDITVKVPILIKETCDFLRKHITTEGIFRKSGSASRVQFLMQRFMVLKKEDEFHFSPCDTVFDVAAVLKQYLREMEVPLIPYSIHDLFLRALEVPPESSREEAVMLCTCLLSEFSLSILTYLIEFLTEVVQNSDSNRMSHENLAIVIGPNIMPVERKKINKAKELEHERKFVDAHTKVVEMLIRNGHKLGCLSPELQKKVESDFSLHGSEDELEHDGVNRRGRSGSLTRMLGFLRKVARNRTGDTPVPQTPDLSHYTHTPVMKSSKRRCLDGNMFSLQKKKTILDSIRKKGLVVKQDDNRLSHLSDTPKSVAGFITCPQPVVINPSPVTTDCKQTPSTAPFKISVMITPRIQAQRKEEIVDAAKSTTRLSSPPKRCNLKRGRPNTLRSGLARPIVHSPRKSLIPRYVKTTQK